MQIKTLSAITLVFLFGMGVSLMAQSNDTVTVNAEIRGFLSFVVDGTDAGGSLVAGDYTTAETCDFGVSDAGGGAITGGDALVTGQTGLPVDGAGLDLGAGGFFDPTCVGAFYRFFDAVGAPDRFNHDDAAVGIFARGSRVTSYSLDVAAIVTPGTGDASVTVDQLKWKANATTGGSGYTDYTSFSGASTNITSGGAGAIQMELYHDYGLLVEFADTPGTYTWTVTYTLTTI
jgi:hypothetical protein